MHFVISVLSGKEKLVKSVLSAHGVECRVPPSMTGFLVCETSVLPLVVWELPHIMGMTVATPLQAEGLMSVYVEQKIFDGMRVQAARGEYAGFFGIVREANKQAATVDFGIYGRMIPAIIPVEEIEQS